MKMNMVDFYKMSIGEGIDLRKEVIKNGKAAGTTFNRETYRHNDLYEYNGNLFQIDSQLGIVDINHTAKDIGL